MPFADSHDAAVLAVLNDSVDMACIGLHEGHFLLDSPTEELTEPRIARTYQGGGKHVCGPPGPARAHPSRGPGPPAFSMRRNAVD